MSGDFAGDLGLIPGQGTRSHMLQLGVYMPQLGPGAPNTLKKNIYIYMCVCVCVCVCVYVFGEWLDQRWKFILYLYPYICICIYIVYLYVHISEEENWFIKKLLV